MRDVNVCGSWEILKFAEEDDERMKVKKQSQKLQMGMMSDGPTPATLAIPMDERPGMSSFELPNAYAQ